VLKHGPASEGPDLPFSIPEGFREALRVAASASGEVVVGVRLRLLFEGGEHSPHVWGQILYRAACSIAHAAADGGGTVDVGHGPQPLTESFVLTLIMQGIMDAYEHELAGDDEKEG
jgi:hypothetical protein